MTSPYGRASGIDHDSVNYTYGLNVMGGWFGDAGVPGKHWITVKVLGANIVGARMATTGGTYPVACIKLLEGSQGVAITGVRPEGPLIEFPSGNAYVLGVSVIGCDFGGSGTPFINKGNCVGLVVLGCALHGNFHNYGLSISGGDSSPSRDTLIHLGYMSAFPITDMPSALVAWTDAAMTDANGVSLGNGSLVLAPRGDVGSGRVGIVAGRDPVTMKPYLVGEFGVNNYPYAKIPAALPQYSAAARPPANLLVPGSAIFNTDSKKLNWSDGTAWYDANGNPV